jgi:aminopeptidase N
MSIIQYFILITILVNFSLSVPLTDTSVEKLFNSRNVVHGETKNWKVKNTEPVIETHQVLNSEFTTYRLPNNTIPIRYNLWLKTDVDKGDFRFEGYVLIHIKALENTGYAVLHARALNITSVLYTDSRIRAYLSPEYIDPYEFVKVTFPANIIAGTDITLELWYTGALRDDEAGFYHADYVENGNPVHYATTQFESTDARHAMPCYDEPAIRAPIGVEIQHHKNYEAVSNMPVVSISEVEDTDYLVTKFQDTPAMQTYLLAFLVSPFTSVSNGNLRVPQKIYGRPSAISRGDGQFAADVSDRILTTYENHLDVLYEQPKLDHAAITQFAAGAVSFTQSVPRRQII